MNGPQILVSYYLNNEAHPNYQLITHLIADLRAAGAAVVLHETNNTSCDVTQDFYQQLQLFQWVILVEIPEAVHSKRIQSLIQAALNMAWQQRMKGVLRVMATPSSAQEIPPAWNALQQFDASKDYPRALAGLLLAMNMERSFDAGGVRLGSASALVDRPRSLLSSAMIMMRPFWQVASTYRSQRLRLFAFLIGIVLLLLSSLGLTTGLIAGAKSTVTYHTGRPVSVTAHQGAAKKTSSSFPPIPGKLVVDDPLTHQDGNNWHQDNRSGLSCTFTGGGYDIRASQPNNRETCLAQDIFVNDFAFQVEMTLIQGNQGGLAFRSDASDTTFYHFYLHANGHYILYVRDAGRGTRILASGNLKIDTHQTNLLAVVARGNHIMLYVNNSLTSDVHDDTLRNGEIGLIAKDLANPTEVVFKNAKLWQL